MVARDEQVGPQQQPAIHIGQDQAQNKVLNFLEPVSHVLENIL
jgi:hypothetical protein